MAAYLATAVLWIAAATRVYATIRRPDPGRVSLTAGALCVALAFTVLATASVFDAQFDWPNGAEIVQHLLFAAAAYATLVFLLFLRRNALPRREMIMRSALALSVGVSMVALFAVAPVHDRSSTNFAVEYGGNLSALLYRAVFDFYLVYCLIGIARICLRHAFTAGDGPRSASLFFVASGCAFAAVAAFAAGTGMLLRYSTGAPLLFLGSVNTVAIALAGILAGIGILAPIPADGLLRWRRPTAPAVTSTGSGPAHQSRSGCCAADAAGAIASRASRADVDPTKDRDHRRPQQNPLQEARGQLFDAAAVAPMYFRDALAEDLAAIDGFEREALSGKLARAAKQASVDASRKSRRRGSEPPA